MSDHDPHPVDPLAPGVRPVERPAVLFLIHDLRPGGAEQVFLHYLHSMRTVRPIPVLVRPVGGLGVELLGDTPTYHLERGGQTPRPGSQLLGQESDTQAATRTGLVAGVSSLLLKSRRLARIAERESADLVCTFLHKSHVLGLVARLLCHRRLRVIVNFHEQPLQHLRFHFGAGTRLLMRANYRWLLPTTDRVVVVADGIRDELVTLGVPRELMVLVRNPIDLDGLRARSRAPLDPADVPPGSSPLVVGVGRLEPIKGFDLLIHAVHQLRRTLPIRLVLVGEGSERRELEELVDTLELGESVRLVGYRQNPLPIVSRADLLAVPSRSEAWPTVIGEALALGTPILASRCSPGVEEFLDGGRYGLLVEPESIGAVAEGLAALFSDESRLRDLARAGPKRAAAFGSAGVVSQYEALLRSEIGARRAAGPG